MTSDQWATTSQQALSLRLGNSLNQLPAKRHTSRASFKLQGFADNMFSIRFNALGWKMKGYIYICGGGIDPGAGDVLNDPLFGPVPTMGACRPDLRQHVEKGDWIFVVSGRKKHLPQYLIGGLRVDEKLDALAAFNRWPQNRLGRNEDGKIVGNIPVDADGLKHTLDGHPAANFERRARNYIFGDHAVENSKPKAVELARAQTLPLLAEVHDKPGNRVVDIMARNSRISDEKVDKILDWFYRIERETNG